MNRRNSKFLPGYWRIHRGLGREIKIELYWVLKRNRRYGERERVRHTHTHTHTHTQKRETKKDNENYKSLDSKGIKNTHTERNSPNSQRKVTSMLAAAQTTHI